MTDKSSVYWALPNEIVALKNTKENMSTNNLIKTRLILGKILDNINSGDKVAVKVHVGEGFNTHYLRHDYVREVVDFIKSLGGIPILIETQGLGMKVQHLKMSDNHTICLGVRKTTEEHEKIAHLHGYTESIIGAPIKFIDGDKGIEYKNVKINGIQFDEVPVASGLFEFDKLVVISHFKAHGAAGFGGALKQLGIGCMAKKGKFLAHFDKMKITNKCDPSKCNEECIEVCPVNAIKINGDKKEIDQILCVGCQACLEYCKIRRAISAKWNPFDKFVERLIDNATGVITGFGKQNIRYVNFAFEVVLNCDCVACPGPPIVPDLGIFGSADPVAVDKACIDAETTAPGIPRMDKNGKWLAPLPSGTEKFKELLKICDPKWQFNAAVKNKIGNLDYELIKI
ncbi:MAG: DUF362 domain-containing protein [Candidatus Helarchaeota archaeon]